MIVNRMRNVVYPHPTKRHVSQFVKQISVLGFMAGVCLNQSAFCMETQTTSIAETEQAIPYDQGIATAGLYKSVLDIIGDQLTLDDLLNLAHTHHIAYSPCLKFHNEKTKDPWVNTNFEDSESYTEELFFHTKSSPFPSFTQSKRGTTSDFDDTESFAEEYHSPTKRRSTFSPYVNQNTAEIDFENKNRNYLNWDDISECTPQRTFWINDHFIELLGLIMNIKADRGNEHDHRRCEIIIERFKQSALPPKSLLMIYVVYLSFNPSRSFREIMQFAMPRLKFYVDKVGFDNEKALYLYHTYLDGKYPDMNGLQQDPLFDTVGGAMGDFIRSQPIIDPIRAKMKHDQAYYESPDNPPCGPQLTLNDVETLVDLDHGITRVDMTFILEVLLHQEDLKHQGILQNSLEKLSKYVNKYVAEGIRSVPSYDIIDFYRQNAEPKVYARFLHFALKARRSYARAVEKMLFQEAHQLLTKLGYDELAKFHENEIKILDNWEKEREERVRKHAEIFAAAREQRVTYASSEYIYQRAYNAGFHRGP